jgi:hypothetical protein
MLHRSDLSLVGHLRCKMRTELRLAAGPLQKDYQPTRQLQREATA